MSDCPHDEYDAYPSSIPRFGIHGVFSVTCRKCKEKIGSVWWEETRPLYFELLTDNDYVAKRSKLNMGKKPEHKTFADFATKSETPAGGNE